MTIAVGAPWIDSFGCLAREDSCVACSSKSVADWLADQLASALLG
jgi:hypothetical protein